MAKMPSDDVAMFNPIRELLESMVCLYLSTLSICLDGTPSISIPSAYSSVVLTLQSTAMLMTTEQERQAIVQRSMRMK